MTEIRLPDVVNEYTKICRICLKNTDSDHYSIHDIGKLCDKTVKISELLSECTSIEIHEEDHMPLFICFECLVKTCKIYKFREMAFKSNILLRQKVSNNVQTTKYVLQQEEYHELNELCAPITEIEESVKDEHQLVDLIQTGDVEDDVEYVTVILSNEDSIECSDENIEIIDDSIEIEAIQDDEYVETEDSIDEIPKISLKKHRNRRQDKDAENRSLTCNECGKTLSNFSSFKYHMQLHSKETPFLCSECGEGFKTRNAYDGHLITHMESNPNSCEICGKRYRQAASLRSHMLTHTGEKPFKCEICGKGMTQKSGYKKHMLIHTGQKPHSCNVCGRQFRYSSNLIMHKRSHEGSKDFECEVCHKKFISKEQLKRHTAIHTGIKPHKCDHCDKCFNRRSTLTIHQKIHQKFKCKSCTEHFDTKIALTLHETQHLNTE